MVGVFSAFALARGVGLQRFGVGLGAWVLIDAAVVRSVLLPTTMKLLGDWNWYYFHRNVYVSFQKDAQGIERRAVIGIDNLAFGTDYQLGRRSTVTHSPLT